MTTIEKQRYLSRVFEKARYNGKVKTQKEFAELLNITPSSLSNAMNGNESYLTDRFIAKVSYIEKLIDTNKVDNITNPVASEVQIVEDNSVLVIPTEAMAGTLGEFAESVSLFDCERIISPIKGADYAIKVYGDSMSPEYPSGSIVLIKKVNEQAFIEWGKVYVLDTDNGAVIKSVRSTELDNVIECVSANPAFQPFRVNTKYIRGWYRVLMVLSVK